MSRLTISRRRLCILLLVMLGISILALSIFGTRRLNNKDDDTQTTTGGQSRTQSRWLFLTVAGERAFKSQNWDLAQRLQEQAAAIAQSQDRSYYRASSSLYQLGCIHYQKGDYSDAAYYYRKAISILEGEIEGPLLADCLDGLAKTLVQEKQYAELDDLFKRSLKIHTEIPVQSADLVRPYLQYGELFEQMHDYGRAEELFNQAIATSESCHNRDRDLCVSYVIGLRLNQGKLDDAVRMSYQALHSLSTGLSFEALFLQIAACSDQLILQKRLAEAQALDQAVINTITEGNLPERCKFEPCNNQARICVLQQRTADAIKIYLKIVPLAKTMEQKRTCQLAVADMYTDEGRFSDAQALYKIVLSECTNEIEINRESDIAHAKQRLGAIFLKQRRFKEASACLREAAVVHQRLMDVVDYADDLHYLSEACSGAGDLRGASVAAHQELALRHSLVRK